MFDSLLSRLPRSPIQRALLLLLIGVAAVQLYAMVAVVRGQVQKSELRDAAVVSQRLALARCLETSLGAGAIDACASSSGDMLVAQSHAAGYAAGVPAMPSMSGFMPASLVIGR